MWGLLLKFKPKRVGRFADVTNSALTALQQHLLIIRTEMLYDSRETRVAKLGFSWAFPRAMQQKAVHSTEMLCSAPTLAIFGCPQQKDSVSNSNAMQGAQCCAGWAVLTGSQPGTEINTSSGFSRRKGKETPTLLREVFVRGEGRVVISEPSMEGQIPELEEWCESGWGKP